MASAIVVAAGKGLRMGACVPKQYLLLGGRPMLAYSLMAFGACRSVESLCLVVPEADMDYCRREIVLPLNLELKIQLAPGGSHRQHSVYNGLCKIEPHGGVVVIHDGARPLVEAGRIEACIRVAEETGACILGIPVADTLKKVDGSGLIETTLERQGVWQAQTPQAFAYNLIIRAHEKARADGVTASDDAVLVERLGGKVKVIPGDIKNIKITTRADLQIARKMVNLNLPAQRQS